MATPTSKKTENSSPATVRYFMRLAYRGENFHGWQRQPGAVSVQEVLEEALARVFRLPALPVTGAGRTDAGVNGSGPTPMPGLTPSAGRIIIMSIRGGPPSPENCHGWRLRVLTLRR